MASLATIAAKTPVAAQMAMWITWFATFAEEAEPLGAACLAKNGARRILYPVGKTPGAPPLNRLALRREFDWKKGLKYISPFEKAEKFLVRLRSIFLSAPSARKKNPDWRRKRIAAIHARCHELGIEAWRIAYMKEKFGRDSLVDMPDEEIETLYRAVMGKKRPPNGK